MPLGILLFIYLIKDCMQVYNIYRGKTAVGGSLVHPKDRSCPP